MIPIILNGSKQYADALKRMAEAETRLADAEERLLQTTKELLALQEAEARAQQEKTGGNTPPPLPPLPPIIL